MGRRLAARQRCAKNLMSSITPLRLGLISAAFCAAVLWLSAPAGALAVALPLLLLGPGYLAQQWLWPDAPPS